MSIGIFVEKNHPPADTEISKALGPMLSEWQRLAQWIRERYLVQEELKFMYGKKYGWALQFRFRGTLLTSLYPASNSFTAQIILNRAALEQTKRMKLKKNAQGALSRAHLYAEGKWLFIQVESKNDVEDVQQLLNLKNEIRRGGNACRTAEKL